MLALLYIGLIAYSQTSAPLLMTCINNGSNGPNASITSNGSIDSNASIDSNLQLQSNSNRIQVYFIRIEIEIVQIRFDQFD